MRSESIKELATALAKVKFGEIGKSKNVKVTMTSGGSYNFQYAPLEDIMSAIRRPLAEQGLSLSQSVEFGDQVVKTALLHSSGEWMENQCPIVLAQKFNKDGKELKPTAQEMGSAISYSRRYGVTLICCLVADEDDDGNVADGNEVQKSTKAFTAPHKPTGEAYAKLSPDMKTFITDLDSRVRTLGGRGDIPGACDEVDETLLPYENRNDLKTALWDQMADVSTLRNAMKKHWANALAATQI